MKLRLLLLAAGLLCFIALSAADYDLIVKKNSVQEDSPLNYACTDLQRYIGQVSGNVPEVMDIEKWTRKKPSAIVVLDYDDFVASTGEKPELNEEGYAIVKKTDKKNEYVFIGGKTELGMVHGVYGFLKELNFEFALGSESIPAELIPFEDFPDGMIVKNPVFQVRGVLPWYNFFNSPTSWDPVDHRTFVDQLIRSGANFITFHSYEHEPFVAVEENGEMIFGEPLRDTELPTWGTNPMKTSEFLYGTDNFYHSDYFGASSTQMGLDRNDQIRLEKKILRDALIYAKKRGLKTSIGFAPLGDPTKKEDRDRFIKEFNGVMEFYNYVDYIFIWQTETKGAQGHPLQYNTHILPDTRDPESKIVEYGNYRRETFKRIVDREQGIQPFFQNTPEGKIARATEGARLELYVKLAYRILQRYNNPPKLAVSGWGGENYLLSEEYYEGLDQVLPKDVAFSSLESLSPKSDIDRAYWDLPADRQHWPIPWLENDGDQWHPQPYLNIYEPMAKSLYDSGSQGFLTIHWRTRDVEDNFGYLIDYSWNPGLTKEEFYKHKSRKYGEYADEVGSVLIELENLGYRWVNGVGQNECAIFQWSSGSLEKTDMLIKLRARVNAILDEIDDDYLTWLRDRMTYVIDYQYAEMQAELARDILAKADASADEAEKQKLARQAFSILSGNALQKAMQSYTQRISTRGEYGVLATMNAKAGYDWRAMYDKCCAILGVDTPMSDEWETSNKAIVPRLYGSVPESEDFKVDIIAPKADNAVLKYRLMNDERQSWKSIPMENVGGWCFSAMIPASDVRNPGIQFVIESENEVIGNRYVTVNPAIQMPEKFSMSGKRTGDMGKIRMTDDRHGVIIEWGDLVEADYYKVYVNGNLEVETPVPYYPYNTGKQITSVQVKACNSSGEIAEISY